MASSGYCISRQEKLIAFLPLQLPKRVRAPVIVTRAGRTPMSAA